MKNYLLLYNFKSPIGYLNFITEKRRYFTDLVVRSTLVQV